MATKKSKYITNVNKLGAHDHKTERCTDWVVLGKGCWMSLPAAFQTTPGSISCSLFHELCNLPTLHMEMLTKITEYFSTLL